MFIQIGTIDLPITKSRGQFRCPVCRETTDYVIKKKKRFLSLYFVIPIFPLEDVDEFLQCKKCRKKFGEYINELIAGQDYEELTREPTGDDHLLRLMVFAMIADGTVDDREVAAIQRLERRHHGEAPTVDKLRQLAGMASGAGISLSDYAESVADEFAIEQKHAAIRNIFLVGTASGELSPQLETQLSRLPEALGVADDVFRNLIAEAAEGAFD